MKLLVDSSSSLLLSLLLAQLPLFTSAVPAPYRRPNVVHELDRLANQTKNLRQITADLLKEHAFETDPEQHRFKSLPLMNNRASDINSLEMRTTLSQLHADLKSFEHHFAWLSRASRKHHHPALPKLGQMMSLIKSLTSMLEHQMMRVDAQRLSPPSPSMPPPPPPSLMCYSLPRSCYYSSDSSVIGPNECSQCSVQSPKCLQYNDDS